MPLCRPLWSPAARAPWDDWEPRNGPQTMTPMPGCPGWIIGSCTPVVFLIHTISLYIYIYIMCTYIHTYNTIHTIHTLHTYIHTYIHTLHYIHTYITYIHTLHYIHTYLPTYIHTYIYMYISIFISPIRKQSPSNIKQLVSHLQVKSPDANLVTIKQRLTFWSILFIPIVLAQTLASQSFPKTKLKWLWPTKNMGKGLEPLCGSPTIWASHLIHIDPFGSSWSGHLKNHGNTVTNYAIWDCIWYRIYICIYIYVYIYIIYRLKAGGSPELRGTLSLDAIP